MARTDPTVYMKLPLGLKTVLEGAAAENRRSLTAEIVARLEESLNPQPGQPFSMESYQALKTDILLELLDELRAGGVIKKRSETDPVRPKLKVVIDTNTSPAKSKPSVRIKKEPE